MNCMTAFIPLLRPRHGRRWFLHVLVAWLTLLPLTPLHAFTPSTLPHDTRPAPANVLLALGNDVRSALQASYTGAYDNARVYEGYFDPGKCYLYDTPNQVFVPRALRNASGGCNDASHWSGNVMNWLTMTQLDQFRSVMTGGTRDNFSELTSGCSAGLLGGAVGDIGGGLLGSGLGLFSDSGCVPGDVAGQTILIRALLTDDTTTALFPDKTLPNIGVPSSLRGREVRNRGYGTRFFVDDNSLLGSVLGLLRGLVDVLSDSDQRKKCPDSLVSVSLLQVIPQNGAGCFNVRVKVCDSAAGLEANCKGPYGTAPNTYSKPEGVVQAHATQMRFGTLSYLKDDNIQRNGGVLRSALKSVGSTNLSATGPAATSNPLQEWNPQTGLLLPNPDGSASTSASGVINLINRFGYTSGYRTTNPVSELFYASQRYLRNLALPADYASGLTDTMRDGFPVFTSAADPSSHSCQKNFIVGMGHSGSHCDGNLPGSASGFFNSTCGTSTPADSLNVSALWASVTGMQGSTSWSGGITFGSPYIAGLAWWSNVNDIRADVAGSQGITTYWADLLTSTGTTTTQLWYATKYGGFRRNLVDSNTSNPNPVRASWDRNNDGQPDTLIAARDPATLRSGLRAAFADMASRMQDSTVSASASGAAASSLRQTGTGLVFQAGYSANQWQGTVRACTPSQTAADCQANPAWEASRWFDTSFTSGAVPKLTHVTRKIFTSRKTSGALTKTPFVWSSLGPTQQSLLNRDAQGNTDTLGADRVAFLRGDPSKEGTLFRTRASSLLGDVVNSNVTYLGGAGPVYRGAQFSGHSAYRATQAQRPGVVYVGANDGMLHAFDARDGRELWAYVPGTVYEQLPALTAPSYVHRYTVDATPMVGDVQTASGAWRTLLVGGLGGGGRGYYALDISAQGSFASMTEAQLATLPAWEFTAADHADLGYTYYEPAVDPLNGAFRQLAKVIVSTNTTTGQSQGAWRAILNNGYGSATHKAVLYLVDTDTGTVTHKLEASSPGTGSNGLSSPTPVDTNGDGLIDTVYAGDLRGRLHKFRFSSSANRWEYAGALFVQSRPITAAPLVTPSCSGSGWQVTFGTGKLNEDTDPFDTSAHAVYSIIDDGQSALPIEASALAAITVADSTTAIGTVRSWAAPVLSGRKGWQLNLPAGGERILSNPVLSPDTGAVMLGSFKPSANICTPAGSSYVMAIGLCSASGALSVRIDDTTQTFGGLMLAPPTPTAANPNPSTGILKLSSSLTASTGAAQSVVCNQADCQPGAAGKAMTLQRVGAPRGRYSWREILNR